MMGETVLTPNADVVTTPIGDALVLFHPTTDRFYELRATAARLWELLAGGSTLAAVRAALLEEYHVTPAALDVELDRAITALVEGDLLHSTGDPHDVKPPLPRELAGGDRLGAER